MPLFVSETNPEDFISTICHMLVQLSWDLVVSRSIFHLQKISIYFMLLYLRRVFM